MEAGLCKAHLYDAIVGVKRCPAVHASFAITAAAGWEERIPSRLGVGVVSTRQITAFGSVFSCGCGVVSCCVRARLHRYISSQLRRDKRLQPGGDGE